MEEMRPACRLTRKGFRWFRSGHPWSYRDDLEAAAGVHGDIVRVSYDRYGPVVVLHARPRGSSGCSACSQRRRGARPALPALFLIASPREHPYSGCMYQRTTSRGGLIWHPWNESL
jgi:hypothetical protein